MAKTTDDFTLEEKIDRAQKALNKKFGAGTLMLLGAPGAVKKVPAIPTGILPLDLATKIGGFPRGRLVEIYGTEGGGKTSVTLHLVAKCQRQGGVAAFVDVEHTLDPELAQAYGVDISKLYFSQPNAAAECFAVVERLIEAGVDLIVVDSLAAIPEDSLMETPIEDSIARVASLARTIGPAIKKFQVMVSKSDTCLVFINQLRSTVNSYGAGPSETTPGGKALKFHASLRLDVRREKAVYGKSGGEQIGHIVKAKITKNKLAPPFAIAKFKLIYGKRITDEDCIADMAAEYGVLERRGAWYWFNGERIAGGIAAVQEEFKERPELAEAVKKKLYEYAGSPAKTEADREEETARAATDDEEDPVPVVAAKDPAGDCAAAEEE